MYYKIFTINMWFSLVLQYVWGYKGTTAGHGVTWARSDIWEPQWSIAFAFHSFFLTPDGLAISSTWSKIWKQAAELLRHSFTLLSLFLFPFVTSRRKHIYEFLHDLKVCSSFIKSRTCSSSIIPILNNVLQTTTRAGYNSFACKVAGRAAERRALCFVPLHIEYYIAYR